MATHKEFEDNRRDPTDRLSVCRVTLIEDSRSDALLLRAYLDAFSQSNPGQCAFRLDHYDTLQRGLEALERDGADIVLLDLGLPDCIGLASYDRIQARFPRLPIVILSGNVDVELAQQAVRRGAQDYLIKGQHNGDAMARAISHALERHRLLEALTARSQQIEDREQQMRLLIESHSDAIFVIEPSARLLYANPASQRLLAGTARLLPGERLPFAVHLEQTTDIEIEGPGDTRIIAELKSQPIEWQGKHAILCTLRDISARKRYESTLEEIARGLSSLSSGEVFGQLASRLAQALGADQIAILRQSGAGEREIQAGFGCTEAMEAVLLAPDFLARVESGSDVIVEMLATEAPPTDPGPQQALGSRQRAGTPVIDRFGQPAGLLLASWPAPAVSPDSVRPILELFAVRASNEFEREDMSSALREERGFLQDVIDAVPVPIMVIDTDYRLLLSNQAARDNRGLSENRNDERICCYQLAHSDAAHCNGNGTDHPCPMREILREPRTLKLEHVHYDAAGERYFAEVFAAPFWGPDGRLRGIIHSTHDITLRRRTEEALIRRSRQLDYLAHHDTVTGLPNRTLFMDRLNRALLRAARQKSRAAVLFLDLDGFKAVNDAFGHDAGDGLLRAIADRLSAALRASDSVARIGGDEFAVLIEELQHEEDAAEIAQKLVEDISPPQLIDGNAVSVGVSIGISFYPEHDRRAEGLLKKADEAMYQAKAQGRCRYHVYDPNEAEAASRQIQPGQALRQAIAHGELRLFYQPQIATTDGRIVCVEALVRWQHPQRGLLTPVNFLGFENDAETEIMLGDWVLETACAEFARWQRLGCAPPSVAVNLFPHQLRDPNLPGKLETLLSTYDLSGDCLEFEILELTIVEEDVLAFEQIQKLDAMGVKITIDNFGSYGSVFANLNRLPIRKIKIDRAIMDENPQRGIIIDSIVGMAHRLNMDITASGIENSQQSEVAKATPGLHVQGYHYAEPMSAQESTEFLRRSLKA